MRAHVEEGEDVRDRVLELARVDHEEALEALGAGLGQHARQRHGRLGDALLERHAGLAHPHERVDPQQRRAQKRRVDEHAPCRHQRLHDPQHHLQRRRVCTCTHPHIMT